MDAEEIFQGCFYRFQKNTIEFLCGFVTTDETQVHHNKPPKKKKRFARWKDADCHHHRWQSSTALRCKRDVVD
jgi:hypothetical protein